MLFLDDGNDRTKRILGLRGRLIEIMTLKRGICRVVGPGGWAVGQGGGGRGGEGCPTFFLFGLGLNRTIVLLLAKVDSS